MNDNADHSIRADFKAFPPEIPNYRVENCERIEAMELKIATYMRIQKKKQKNRPT